MTSASEQCSVVEGTFSFGGLGYLLLKVRLRVRLRGGD